MKRVLIVNADDCNLTPGVTRAILKCHDEGIVSSTTWMVNLPFTPDTVRSVLKRRGLGVGIHLNVTLGMPVSSPQKVRSLIDSEGRFSKLQKQLGKLPEKRDLVIEYASQVEKFKKIFGRYPTHLDTHHQVHDHPLFFHALIQVAIRYGLPIRRSSLMRSPHLYPPPNKLGRGKEGGAWKTTDFFFGNFSPAGYWKRDALETVLETLPEGTSEIMCHPGYHDRDLGAISSFTEGREQEFRLLRSGYLRKKLNELEINLQHFGLFYTKIK
ncbi:MAG TPA: ChbG/HpnK family deacetylase [bacterium]|nr:ChbG/HpnK family deacetylase [bacterium]